MSRSSRLKKMNKVRLRIKRTYPNLPFSLRAKLLKILLKKEGLI